MLRAIVAAGTLSLLTGCQCPGPIPVEIPVPARIPAACSADCPYTPIDVVVGKTTLGELAEDRRAAIAAVECQRARLACVRELSGPVP